MRLSSPSLPLLLLAGGACMAAAKIDEAGVIHLEEYLSVSTSNVSTCSDLLGYDLAIVRAGKNVSIAGAPAAHDEKAKVFKTTAAGEDDLIEASLTVTANKTLQFSAALEEGKACVFRVELMAGQLLGVKGKYDVIEAGLADWGPYNETRSSDEAECETEGLTGSAFVAYNGDGNLTLVILDDAMGESQGEVMTRVYLDEDSIEVEDGQLWYTSAEGEDDDDHEDAEEEQGAGAGAKPPARKALKHVHGLGSAAKDVRHVPWFQAAKDAKKDGKEGEGGEHEEEHDKELYCVYPLFVTEGSILGVKDSAAKRRVLRRRR